MNSTQDKIQKWTLDLGKVDYSGRGRKTNRVTLDVELRHKANDVAPYLDIDLKECREYAELSICGNVWNAAGSDIITGGQCTDTIRELFPAGPVRRLVDIWDRWHLNGMKAGARVQEDFLRDNPVTDRLRHYEAACKVLEAANLLHVSGPGNPNYKYGSAWLVDRLPTDVEAEVVRLCGELTASHTATAPEHDPQNFAQEHGITAIPVQVESNPHMPEARDGSRHWKVTLRKGAARLTVPFTQGSAHTKTPTAIDVLSCLASDAQSADYTFAEWCSELGFDADSRSAEKTFKAVKKQSAALRRFLGDGLFRALLQDSQG
jgi:hypothetical protein